MFKIKFTKELCAELDRMEDNSIDISAGPLELDAVFDSIIYKHEKEVLNYPEIDLRDSLSVFIRKLRIMHNLTYMQLASKIDVDVQDLIKIERDPSFKPNPRTLNQLSAYFKIPYKFLLQSIGAIKNMDKQLQETMIKYAAKSDTSQKLTREEQTQLNQVLDIIKKTVKD